MKVNILGTEYTILRQNELQNPKLKDANGLCEYYSKKIVIDDMKSIKNEIMTFENLKEFESKVMRHEVIHAFLAESGLRSNSDWAENEEMVDFFAIQFHKIKDVFEKLGI